MPGRTANLHRDETEGDRVADDWRERRLLLAVPPFCRSFLLRGVRMPFLDFAPALSALRSDFAPPSPGRANPPERVARGSSPPVVLPPRRRRGGRGSGSTLAALLALIVFAAAVAAFLIDVAALTHRAWDGGSETLLPMVAALALIAGAHATWRGRQSPRDRAISDAAGGVALLACLALLAGAFAHDRYGLLAAAALSACMAAVASMLVALASVGTAGE